MYFWTCRQSDLGLDANTGSNLISEQGSQKGHQSVFSIEMPSPSSSGKSPDQLLVADTEEERIVAKLLGFVMQCSADLQVYAFAALGVHPAPCQSLRDIFHQAQNFRGTVTIVFFLVLIRRCVHLPYQSCEPTTSAPRSSRGGGLSARPMPTGRDTASTTLMMLIILESKKTGNGKSDTKRAN